MTSTNLSLECWIYFRQRKHVIGNSNSTVCSHPGVGFLLDALVTRSFLCLGDSRCLSISDELHRLHLTQQVTVGVYVWVKRVVLTFWLVTMALMPSGKRKRLYSVSTVSLGSTLHSLCSRMGPVSRPSSAQNTLKPAFLSP